MSVKRHTTYNLFGSVVPILISVLTVPLFLHLVGDTRFGIIALVWIFLGYFGLFDPGIGRAASYHIARLHEGSAKDRESIFWTAVVVNLSFGLVAGVVLYLVAHPFFMSIFKMPEAMRGEVIACLPWLAAFIPISIVTGVLSGVLQAREWFGVSNAISVSLALLSQVTPLAVAYFYGPNLTWLIVAILLARVAGAIPLCISVARALPLGAGGSFDWSLVRTLFSYGGWIAVSNLLNPLLTAMDQMLIGSILSADAVAYYSVPFNLVSRISVVPGSLSLSLFPKLSRGSTEDGRRLASEAVVGLAAVMTPLVVIGITVMPIFLKIWVGAAFAAHAAPVGMILLVGMWVNGLSYIPYVHLQANNRPDLIAKFHAIEVVPYLVLLWISLHYFGLVGAAGAWTLRVAVDALLLFGVAGHLDDRWYRVLPGGVIVAIAPFCAPAEWSPSVGFACALLAVAVLWSWTVAPSLRSIVKAVFMRLLSLRRS